MTIDTMKQTSFEQPTVGDWSKAAEASLKGKPLASLETKTPEGITLKPLYTAEDLPEGQEDRVRAIRDGIGKTDWMILQETREADPAKYLEKVKSSLGRGNGAVVYAGGWEKEADAEVLAALAALITEVPVHVRCRPDDPFLAVFGSVPENKRRLVAGYADVDRSADLSRRFPLLRTIAVDTGSVHMKGADAVTELAAALSEAAEIAGEEDDFDQMARKLFFAFDVDTHFFTEIAKLRAFRLLFRSFAAAYGVEEPVHVPVIARTSLRTHTLADPYVNLLRSGNEAFAAAIGGADAITVAPLDTLTGSTGFSERVARNVQHILKEEAHADRVLDPSGGSYYIESLTGSLYRKAWELFLQFEKQGGITAITADGTLDRMLADKKEVRIRRLAVRKESLIGTNIYADPAEAIRQPDGSDGAEGRFAEPFEAIRSSLQGSKVHLIRYGSLKAVKPVADFAAGVLAVGGIRPELSPLVETVEEALGYMASEQPVYAIFCAPADQAEEAVRAVLAGKPDLTVLDAAGRFPEETEASLREAGLQGFYYKGQDILDKLAEVKGIVKGGMQQ
ncbi:methylmalonyl-CoA mutase family protein [Bhargavaea beijingensis]|uniref:Methylmalonyl-CoA mutase n=1 Tax=Bhargavaea beijingensis TaxID=426756 RepID=A0A1G7DIG2_9BACL|nr:methylmalonyl-CoA mutase family protein [Bhargavaea beijingensis]MCW1927169.1 methylmalonyl-CoA mutase family protein [Bhargavaea beijingensis]RSK30889.1 methylmalonyl-CoA mutase [Bhargavaea beijingensis]SDE51291.1 methylmalonyl-CoA mutase [Bhargavaea beijingensis]